MTIKDYLYQRFKYLHTIHELTMSDIDKLFPRCVVCYYGYHKRECRTSKCRTGQSAVLNINYDMSQPFVCEIVKAIDNNIKTILEVQENYE